MLVAIKILKKKNKPFFKSSFKRNRKLFYLGLDIEGVLEMNWMDDYIYEDIIKKVKLVDIPIDDKLKYKRFRGSTYFAYDLNVTDEMLSDESQENKFQAIVWMTKSKKR